MIRVWLGIVVSLVAFGLVLTSIDVQDTLVAIGRIEPGPLAAAVLLVLAQVALVSFRWSLLLPRGVGYTRIPTGRTVGPVLIGYLGNVALPARLGDAARAYLISRRESISVSAVLGSVLLERLTDTATGALIALLLAVVLGAPIWVIQLAALAAAAAVGVVIIIAFVGAERLIHRLAAWFRRSQGALNPRLIGVVARLAEGMRVHDRRPVVAYAALLSFLNWMLEGVIYWLVAMSLGFDMPIAAGLLVATITVLATAIPAAPGYLGTFELAAVAASTALGVPASEALAFALLAHAVTVLPLAVGGLAVVLPMGLSLDGIRRAASAAEHPALAAESVPVARSRP